jgi:UDP-glucose 4-epimerase
MVRWETSVSHRPEHFMRVLVTGAEGFIASHLCEFLESKGYEVLGLDNERWYTRKVHNTVVGDVRDYELIDFLVSQVDEVYHLAAMINVDYGNENPRETIDINVQGTLNVLEACRKYNVPMVYASTSEVYGSSQAEFMDEKHPLDAQSVYAASKLSADRMCKAYADTYGLNVRILRNFNTFGKWQRYDSYGGVIAKFVDNALKGKAPVIYGDGTQRRDYMWVEDAVRGYEIIAEKGKPGEVINVGTGKTISINELASLVQKYTGCPDATHIRPRPGEVQRLCADITKARSLGFEPKTNFEENLKEYINWKKYGGRQSI